MSSDLISIIIPIYNVAQFLDRCVQSVRNQTYKNLEIILVDDGSPDNCPQMCDSYAAEDSRIRVVHKPNGGLSSARNAGIDVCSGQWLMFVDSDDFIAPDMAEKLLSAAKAGNAKVAYCTLFAFTEDDDGYNEYRLWDAPADGVTSGAEILQKSVQQRQGLLSGHHVIACNKIYHRTIFGSLRYPVGQLHEDEAIAHRVISQCENIICINLPLYCYRQRKTSIIGSGDSPLRHLSIALAYGDRALFYQELDLPKSSEILFKTYWGTLFAHYRSIKRDLSCRPLIKKLRLQMRNVQKLYCTKPEISSIRKLAVKLFCLFPAVTSKLFALSIKIRHTN